MGGSSAHGSSDSVQGSAFDVTTESGTLELLRNIHLSALDLDTKNSLRDMLFTFRTQKGATVSSELAAHFSTHGFELLTGAVVASDTPAAAPASEPVAAAPTMNRLGMSRQAPSFGAASATVSTPTPKQEPAPEPAPAPDPVATPDPAPAEPTATPTPEPAPVAQAAPVVAPEPVVTPEPVATPAPAEPTATPTPEPVVTPTPEPVQNEPKVIGTPTPDPVSQPGPAPAVAPGDGLNSPEANRIKEIKHEVNEMVGNPVNLIDVHNEVGREYMNSLLDAMKKTAGGSATDVSMAMQRLESSFAAVKETMGVHERGEVEKTPVDRLESTVPKKEVKQASAETPVEPVAEPEAKPEPAVHTAPAEPVAAPESKPEETAAPMQAQTPLSSVAKEKQVQEMMVAQKREAATTEEQRKNAEIAGMDPLMVPEVTAGLNQLLSDWSIFKNSGIFGTGPSGPEHPLYKKMAQVPMAAIVAGRFDGVTPQIKRTISDTMNGWRYEEGVIHEQGETFELYLRRVIKHILEKRKLDSEA